MGERRLRAARAAGLDTVPAIVRDTTDDALLRDALLENIHRVQLNPLEEAAAYQQLLEEFGATHEELASKIGRSRSQVTNTIRLLKLPVKVQTRVAAGVISAGHARALLGSRRRRGAGRARHPDRRRGHVGARHRGGGRHGRRRAAGHQAADPPDLRPRCRGARLAAVRHVRDQGPDPDRPGQGDASSSSSDRSTTCSGSSASWRRRSPDAVPRPDRPGPRGRVGYVTGRNLRSALVAARRASSRASTSPSS